MRVRYKCGYFKIKEEYGMKRSKEIIPKEFLWCIPKVYRSRTKTFLDENFTVYYAFWRFLFNGVF